MTDKQPLFSESQVEKLAEAKYARWVAEERLIDAIPQTITINRLQAIKALKEMETEIRKKHGEAVAAWKKANTMYADHIKKNPGSKAMSPPGNSPTLAAGIEDIRSAIRAYGCVPGATIKVSRGDWMSLFTTGGNAIRAMRASRDQYVATVSGAIASNLFTYNLASTPG
jgi:hypothetical protein